MKDGELERLSREELVERLTELEREKYRKRYAAALGSTVGALMVAAAVAVLICTLWLPVLRIYGGSMTPTVQEGEVVVCVKTGALRPGDLTAFYLGNKLLVKRCIAGPGQWVDMDEDGIVSVDGTVLEEPYLQSHAPGAYDLAFPCQVPEGRWFCMGDNRALSVDSRHSAVGWVAQEQVVGRVVFRVWPLSRFGRVN